MSKIYTASFGSLPVRFVLKNEDLFVSKIDLYAAITECFTERIRALGVEFIDKGLCLLGDSADRAPGILGDSEIGPAIHFHAAGALLGSLSDLIDVDSDDLRESSFRVNTLWAWYSESIITAVQFFGRTAMDMLSSVKNRLDRINPAILVHVTQGDGMYTAECDSLHLVTEAYTFEELTERVWELAPDMIEANDLSIDPGSLRLRFELFQDSAISKYAL